MCYFGSEEVLVALELVGKSLVWGVDELDFVTNPLQEGVKDLNLNVIVVVHALLPLVVCEKLVNLFIQSTLLLVQVINNVVVVLLLLVVDHLQVLVLLPEPSQFFYLRSQFLFLVPDLRLNLTDDCCDLLQSLVLLAIQVLLGLGDPLDFVVDAGIARDALLFFQVFHEVLQVVSPALEDVLRPLQDSDLCLDFAQDLFHLFELVVLAPQVLSVLLEVSPLHVITSPGPFVLGLLVAH
jgi:hypothetical protein